MMKLNCNNLKVAAAGAVALLASSSTTLASTVTIDLRTGPTASAMVAGARFEVVNPTNTAQSVSFLQLQNDGVQHGYNSGIDMPKFNTTAESGGTRSIRFSDLVRSSDGQFFEFMLDVNQAAGSTLALERLAIYTDSRADVATTTLSFETLRYTMDKISDRTVLLSGDVATGGVGSPDLRVLIPVGAFVGSRADDFVYLYSMFSGANGGVEEWGMPEVAFLSTIPLPSAAGLGLAGLFVVAGVRRRR